MVWYDYRKGGKEGMSRARSLGTQVIHKGEKEESSVPLKLIYTGP